MFERSNRCMNFIWWMGKSFHNNFKSILMTKSFNNDLQYELFLLPKPNSPQRDKLYLLYFFFFIQTNCTIMFVLRFEWITFFTFIRIISNTIPEVQAHRPNNTMYISNPLFQMLAIFQRNATEMHHLTKAHATSDADVYASQFALCASFMTGLENIYWLFMSITVVF